MKAKRIWLTSACVGIAVFSQGCSLEKPDAPGGSLKITLEDRQHSLSALGPMLTPQLDLGAFGDIGIQAPTTVSDFNCFVVNVTGSGVPSTVRLDGCTVLDNFGGKGPGIFSEPVTRGQTITVDVPSGLRRNIDVFGIFPPVSECGGTNSGGGTQDLYILGSQTVDLLEPQGVTIPISFSSATAKSLTCTDSHSSTQLSLLTGGYTTTCQAFASPPTAPAPTTTPPGTVMSGIEITEATTENATIVEGECTSAGATQMSIMEFHFDVSGINLAGKSRFDLIWKGLAGSYSGSCTSNATMTATGAQIFLYNYDNGTSPTWVSMGTTSNTTGIETISQVFSTTPSLFPFNNRIIVRVISPTTASGDCAVVRTDYIKLLVQ